MQCTPVYRKESNTASEQLMETTSSVKVKTFAQLIKKRNQLGSTPFTLTPAARKYLLPGRDTLPHVQQLINSGIGCFEIFFCFALTAESKVD